MLLEQYESYQKMSFRNRYVIYGANGLIHLSVPIRGGREQKQVFKDVEIDYTDKWPLKHWRAIVSSYSKSPYFEYYSQEIQILLFSKKTNLSEFNINALKWCFQQLKLQIEISLTSNYKNQYEKSDDFRNYFLPKNFQSNGDNQHVKYVQVFENRFGFQENLSILDLLFAEGPNAKSLLAESVK